MLICMAFMGPLGPPGAPPPGPLLVKNAMGPWPPDLLSIELDMGPVNLCRNSRLGGPRGLGAVVWGLAGRYWIVLGALALT